MEVKRLIVRRRRFSCLGDAKKTCIADEDADNTSQKHYTDGSKQEPIILMSKQNDKKTSSIWGGRFNAAPDQIMDDINASIGFDKRLYRQDIAGSKAHAAMLTACGIISAEDETAIQGGLDHIKEEIEQDQFTFRRDLEDIHMNIESRLKELIGDAAGRLHTGRSRNDQVATDFRLWLRDSIDAIISLIQNCQNALLDKAEKEADTVMPGFTHLQTAQPVTFGHHLMAYVEMLGRDKDRLIDCRKRLNKSPLGAAALAGTSFPIDREMTAKALGFDAPCANSLDAVSDRDFALEFLAAASILAIHLSRFGEELVVYSSAPFSFLRLPDSFTTGSSIMPQKRNPDAAELVRARSGRIVGALNALLIVMKSLPLAYSKDMQDDKEPVFDTVDSLSLCLQAMTGMISRLETNKDSMRNAAAGGFSTATDLADWLVREQNLPFRDAHHVTGALVKLAEDTGRDLPDLSLSEMQAVHASITEDIFDVLTVEKSVQSRTSYGGTAPVRVKEQIARVRNHLKDEA